MAIKAEQRFKADGVWYDPGDPVPLKIFRDNSKATMLGAGLISEVPDDFSSDHMPPHTSAALVRANYHGVSLTEVEPTGADGQITADDVEAYVEARDAEREQKQAQETPGEVEGEPKATDAAKREAAKYEIDLEDLEPYASGADGSILIGDVEQYLKENPQQPEDEDEEGSDEE